MKILLVDDDPILFRSLRDVLRKQGYEVESAGNGLGALTALHSERFDVMICDIQMPAMDGRQLVREIRGNSAFSYLQILVLSATPPEEFENLTALPNVMVFSKPQDPDTIRTVIDVLVRK